MSFDELASVGEFVGGIAVVFTLMYLAYETRRSTTMHVASSTSDAYVKWAEFNDLTAGDPELVKLWSRVWNNESLSDFSDEERIQLTVMLRSLTQRLAAVHQQHQKKLIDDEFWLIHKTYFAAFYRVKAISEWWEIEKQSSLFTESFIREVDGTKGFTIGLGGQRILKESA